MPSAWEWFRTNVTIFSFIAGVTAAVFAALNYFNQSSNQPDLVSTPNNHVEGNRVTFQFENNGRRPVQRGVATLFSFGPERNVRLAEVGKKTKIEGAGVAPGALMVYFDNFDASKLSGTVLVCTSYFDDQGKPYNKAFSYQGQREGMTAGYGLDQLQSPSYDRVCR